MTITEQLNKIKENWLILAIVIVLLGVIFFVQPSSITKTFSNGAVYNSYESAAIASNTMMYKSANAGYYPGQMILPVCW